MDIDALKQILAEVAAGNTSVDQAAQRLTKLPFEDIGYAHVDHHRSLRKGFPEVIYGQGKSAVQICGIMAKMVEQEKVVLVTRVSADKATTILEQYPEAQYYGDARVVQWQNQPVEITAHGTILVITAGTSDIPVGMEAVVTAAAMGNTVEKVFDVGVSGIHRLLDHREMMARASIIIVVAGMEGALPSVVAGMVNRPVIAVPTSIGYGVSMSGLTALFAMLNSCSSNVTVVNIDNGFGAAYFASMVNHLP
jgi:NCAIR mutase (PurE)-related protein